VSAGGAMISPKHPNFIVNVLGAGSPDVINLIILAKAEVKKKFGISMEEEVQLL
jgi:UDP-N-acetylmuramate dehydrogenase